MILKGQIILIYMIVRVKQTKNYFQLSITDQAGVLCLKQRSGLQSVSADSPSDLSILMPTRSPVHCGHLIPFSQSRLPDQLVLTRLVQAVAQVTNNQEIFHLSEI